jgi:hypothetical protein
MNTLGIILGIVLICAFLTYLWRQIMISEINKIVDKMEPFETSQEILDELDSDMEDSGMAQGEIESNLNHWKNKYIITRK